MLRNIFIVTIMSPLLFFLFFTDMSITSIILIIIFVNSQVGRALGPGALSRFRVKRIVAGLSSGGLLEVLSLNRAGVKDLRSSPSHPQTDTQATQTTPLNPKPSTFLSLN